MIDDIDLYLPPYLSRESASILVECLKDFPENINEERLYVKGLENKDILFQGDALRNIDFFDLDNGKKVGPALILSNTCDMDVSNKRMFETRIVYSPIVKLDNYIKLVESDYKKKEKSITAHVDSIKKQHLTEILFLPRGRKLDFDGIVFLSRLYSCRVKRVLATVDLGHDRLFCLSDYGYYLFLLKLSVHFCRMGERIDRFQGTILQN